VTIAAPRFWSERNHPAARLLSPFGALYGAIAARRMRHEAPVAGIPLIVIGGLTAGGDGKTPLALAIAARLIALGARPAFSTRGYGRAGSGAPFLVDLSRCRPRQAGDEARLLARLAPTFVGADRRAAAEMAKRLGADVLVLDDGFHSRRLAADLALLAIDSQYGAGNGRCLPAGPLRAPLAAQIAAADALVSIGDGAAAALPDGDKPRFLARLAPCPSAAQRLAGARVFAFAGIARPEKFRRTLQEMGAEVVGTRWFGDHHWFTARDLRALRRDAEHLGAALVTTEKDAARLADPEDIDVLPARLEFADPASLDALLSRVSRRD